MPMGSNRRFPDFHTHEYVPNCAQELNKTAGFWLKLLMQPPGIAQYKMSWATLMHKTTTLARTEGIAHVDHQRLHAIAAPKGHQAHYPKQAEIGRVG